MTTASAPAPKRRAATPAEPAASSEAAERIDAVHLADGMLTFALEHDWVHVPDELRGVLPLADVVHDAERFGAQYRYALDNGLPLPVMRSVEDGDFVLPVNADSAFFPMGRPADRRAAEEALYRATDAEEFYPRGMKLDDPGEAASSFRRRLGQFLTARVDGVEELGGEEDADTAAGPPPDEIAGLTVTERGILFQVYTRTQGLRVHVHPVYWHDPNRVFGQPSSPVVGYLQPGRYVFGATGMNLPLWFDLQAEYDVPGTTTRADLPR